MKSQVLTYILISFLTALALSCGVATPLFADRESEIKKGSSISKKIEKKFKTVDNWRLQNRVETIGQKLAAVCDRKDLPYYFEILSDDNDNAFAIPGGYVYMFKGLVDKLESDDEIAAVLAHEIGHINAEHHSKRKRGSIGYTALMLLIGQMETDPVSRRKAYIGINELMMSYSREDELEADTLAVGYMRDAGFNPEANLSVLEKLRKINHEKPIRRKMYWRTHPYIDDRIKAVREQIFGKIEFEDYINTMPEFDKE